MVQLVIKIVHRAAAAACAFCGQETAFEAGPHLATATGFEPVCPRCSHRHAPAEAALLDLARNAARVGAIALHNTFWIPLRAQLDLVHAAEQYAFTLGEQQRRLSQVV